MRTVEIDEGLYEFLLRNAKSFGESPSDVLRRLLNLPALENPQSGGRNEGFKAPQTQAGVSPGNRNPAAAFLNSPAFLVHGNAVGRFLTLLSWLSKQNPDRFEKVLLLAGRKRRYFAKSAAELEASGNSVMPKRVPDTLFWVVTNSPTQLKRQIIADVMRVLGYDIPTTQMVKDALR